MTTALFHLDPLPTSDVVVLAGPEGRHAATVRRIAVGEHIAVGDGRGHRRRGEVVAVGRDELTLRCGPVETTAAADPQVVVVQALPKGDRAELAVELLTELGVDVIVPWSADRSIVQWRGERALKSRRRWQDAAREAGKQSRRVWFPEVTELADTATVGARIARSAAAFTLHEAAQAPLVEALLPPRGEIVVVVGPEGGLTPDEVAAFEAAGSHPVRLGAPVLRTSTAGAAALAVLSARLGRWV